MKNFTAALLLFLATTIDAQIVNRFRDSTIFYNKVQFDSLIRITEGAQNGYVLTSDATGNATWQAGGGSYIAENGLNLVANRLRLGGTLDSGTTLIRMLPDGSIFAIQDTDVDPGGNALGLLLSNSFNIYGAPFASALITTTNFSSIGSVPDSLTGISNSDITAVDGTAATISVTSISGPTIESRLQSSVYDSTGGIYTPISDASIVTYKIIDLN